MLSADQSQSTGSRAGPLDLVALGALVAGALATVLVVLPYRSFDLDRFFAPKELALHAAALVAGLAVLARARRLAITRVDLALTSWLAFSAISSFFATNHWVAFRAMSISLSGSIVFWAARRVAAVGLGGLLARALAVVVLAGTLTALAQAYGVKMEFAALNRAPGGTFGNRNFMAHLAAIGAPVFVYCVATARSRLRTGLWIAALAACAVALVLSRTRAAWLALMVCGVVAAAVAVSGPPLLDAPGTARRLRLAMGGVLAGVALALFAPNALDWRSDNPYLESVVGVVNFREGSGKGRLRQYANSVKMAVAHPLLGVGPGNWPVSYPVFAPSDDPSLAEGTGMTANPWPSSDWVAAVSERGVPAALALAIAMVLLVGGALRVRYDEGQPAPTRLAAFAGAAALGIAVIEGGFDAVLLLPASAIVVWALAGALLPARSTLLLVTLTTHTRAGILVAVAALGVSATLASAGRMEAMRLYGTGTAAAMDDAVRWDPGSYRLHVRAAELYLARGQCARARPQALAARRLFPNAPAPKRVLAQCK